MMATAERHGELIADFAAKCWWLRESEVVSICRASLANETSLLGDKLDVRAVANAPRRRQCQHALIDNLGPSFPASFGRTVFEFVLGLKGRDLLLECSLDMFGIGSRQRGFGAKDPMSPTCGFIGRSEVLHFGRQSIS